MKLTIGILVLGMAVGTAWGQNPDVIENTRNTLKAVEQKKAMDSNAALAASQGQPAKPAAPVSAKKVAAAPAKPASTHPKTSGAAAPVASNGEATLWPKRSDGNPDFVAMTSVQRRAYDVDRLKRKFG